jgi:8-oxo-dGTP diphosphatase
MSLVTSRRGDELLEFHPGTTLHLPEAARAIPLPLALMAAQYEGKILFVFNRWRDVWELPGGLIEAGEHPADAAKREFAEETGQTAPGARYVGWMKFRLQPDRRLELAALYQCHLEAVRPFEANEETTAIMFWDVNSPVAERVCEIDRYLAALVLRQKSEVGQSP